MLEFSGGVLDERPLHFAKIWNIPYKLPKFNWMEPLTSIKQAPTFYALIHGYPDFSNGVFRNVNMFKLLNYHKAHWDGFEKDMIDYIDSECPGYKKARAIKKTLHLKQRKVSELKKKLLSGDIRRKILNITFLMSSPAAKKPKFLTEHKFQVEYTQAKSKLEPFINAYLEYSARCAGIFDPQANDSADLFNFIYLQDNSLLFTYDKRWIEIAKVVCPQNLFH